MKIFSNSIQKLISGEKPENVKIMGNLPYYITTPIIMKLLEEGVKAESITIMMQKGSGRQDQGFAGN